MLVVLQHVCLEKKETHEKKISNKIGESVLPQWTKIASLRLIGYSNSPP